jgi:hypothetical protein
MKTLNWIGWISLGIGAIIMLLAGIFLITGKGMFGFKHIVNHFHAANTFILFSIAIFLYVYRCECKK